MPVKRFSLQLREKKQVAADAYSFFFSRIPAGENTPLEFEPGQYLRMILSIEQPDERGSSHFFTIASSPSEKDYIMITTRIIKLTALQASLIKSTFKMRLSEVQIGDEVSFQGPFGMFVLNEDGVRPRVFLAGGIGITPFRCMSIYAKDMKLVIPITLLASFSHTSDIVFLDEFETVKSILPNFTFVVTITKQQELSDLWQGETGRIDALKVEKYVSAMKDSIFFAAGSPGFVSAMSDMLLQLGVEKYNIMTEEFTGY